MSKLIKLLPVIALGLTLTPAHALFDCWESCANNLKPSEASKDNDDKVKKIINTCFKEKSKLTSNMIYETNPNCARNFIDKYCKLKKITDTEIIENCKEIQNIYLHTHDEKQSWHRPYTGQGGVPQSLK